MLATLVPLGCSSPSSVAANRQALQAPGPACNDGSVSTSVCSGPWEYQTYVAGCVGEMGPSWDCGSHMVPDPPNAVPNRCCDAALGLTPDHVDITSDPVDGQWVECGLCSPEFPCTWCHNGACDDICDVLPDVPPPGGLPGNVIAGFIDHNGNVIADCNSYAQTQVAQRTLTAKDGTQYTPVVTTAVLHHDSTHAWCVVGLDIEIFGCGENAGVCGTHSVDPGTQHLTPPCV